MQQTADEVLQFVPPTRVYIHLTCQQATAVDDEPPVGEALDYVNYEAHTGLSNPLLSLDTRTMCSHCGDFFPLTEFAWQDTGESLYNFRARWQNHLPAWMIFVSGFKCFAALAILFSLTGLMSGIAVGLMLGSGIYAAMGAVVGLVSFVYLSGQVWSRYLGPECEKQAKQMLRVQDFRQLK